MNKVQPESNVKNRIYQHTRIKKLKLKSKLTVIIKYYLNKS